MSDRSDHHRRRNRDQDQPDEREPLRRRRVENKESPPMIPKGPPAGGHGAPIVPKKGPPVGAPVVSKKGPPVGVVMLPPPPPAPVSAPGQMAAPPMQPPPQNPRGTAGRAPAHPKGKAPPPPSLPIEDVWNNRNVSSENKDRLTTCVPEWFCNSYGLGADGKHILDWRASVERFMDSDLPTIRDTSVEGYLRTLRRENRRTGEQVAQIALALKGEM
eukprot:5104088-Amphidinium_carterae.1